MVAINELRIGNLVSTNGKPMNTSNKGVYKVLAIDSRDLFEELKGCVIITTDDPICNEVGAWCQYLEPIPLTPELLKKCVFKYDTDLFFKSKDIDVLIAKQRLGITSDSCKSLHQLQNMYYAITNKELEVNNNDSV